MAVHKKAESVASFVKYEWDMFYWISQQPIGAMPESPEKNLLVEGLLLHSRVLRDFLTVDPTKLQADDVWAGHFFDDEQEWVKKSAGLCPILKKERPRVNKAVTHLSYTRIEYERAKGWNPAFIQEISEAWSTFWQALPEERRKWFFIRRA